MRVLTTLRRAILPRHETRVIPWPGWDDADALPPVWDLDDWIPYGPPQVLQGGVRGIAAWRRVPRWERVVRWFVDGFRSAIRPPDEAPSEDAGSDDVADADDDVPVRPKAAYRRGRAR